MRATRMALWASVFLAAAVGAAAALPLTVEDIFQLELPSDPQLSPDGKRVVYVRGFADAMADLRRSNLWIVDRDGANHRPLTSGNTSDSSPRWSPDGSQIAFISDRDGAPQIYRRFMDTGEIARLSNLTSPPAGLAWSPDGRWLSFIALVPAAAPQIAGMPKPPPGASWADPPVVIDRLLYRFNGAGYLKPGYHHLFVMPAEGGTPRQISSGDFHHGGPGLRASDAVWTPDGKFLILSANRRADWDTEPLDSEVFEFAVADGAVRALTDRRGPDAAPVVSPDGARIAYLGFDDRYQGYQVTRLYLMERDGSNPRELMPDFDRDVANLRWAADGSGLLFTADEEGNTGLYFVGLDGRRRRLASDLGSSFSAYGGGGSVSNAQGGVFATTTASPHRPGDIAVGSLERPGLVPLTRLNEDLLAQRALGAVEEIWYPSKKDGRRIQGWIIKPPGFDPGRKYPLVLEIHGGPFANYGDRFDLEKQLIAARDYVVLYTNPRGSTSYGQEFGNLIHHAYPGDDFFDLDSGVDAMLERGYVDADNLMVTGGSGGGVLTCWMIGRTTRFRAAVTVYPVINWYSFNLTADIGNMTTKYWFPGLPWDHVEHYERRSLLSVVENVKTPTMVLTGEEDYRTPMSESEQYFQALQLLSVESQLVRVPGEPHGISRRPSHHMAKILAIIGWFDQHRSGAAVAPTGTTGAGQGR